MPFPILLGLAAWELVAGVVATATVAYGAKKAYDHWFGKDEQETLAKKKIVVIGRSGVGKTTLLNFLRNGKVQAASEATNISSKGRVDFLMNQLGINASVLESVDVVGGDPGQWKNALLGADYVMYLAKVGDVFSEDVKLESKITDGLRRVRDSIDDNKTCVVGVVLTFCDELDDYNESSAFYSRVEEKVKYEPIYRSMQTYFSGRNFLVSGSLRSQDSTERLFKRLVQEIKSAG